MPAIPILLVRDDSSNSTRQMTPTMMNLLIALVVLFFLAFCCVAALLILRARRRSRQIKQLSDLPFQANRPTSEISNPHRLTLNTASYQPIRIRSEKEIMVDQSPSSPTDSIPEIRITFPEEEDAGGKRKSGRVVVVRISETGGVGLEPYSDEHLPPYQKSEAERFQSLDLERMGGLKEMEHAPKM